MQRSHSIFLGSVFFAIGVGFTSIAFDLKRLLMLLGSIGFIAVFNHLAYFHPNMLAHSKLVKKRGQPYLDELEVKIANERLITLLLRRWFVKAAREANIRLNGHSAGNIE